MSGSEWRLRLSRTLPSRCCQLDVPTRPQPDGPCHPPGPVTAPSSLPGPPQPEEASQSLDVIGRCPWENLPKAPHCNWNKRRNFYRGDKAILGFSLSFKHVSFVPESGSLHLLLPLLRTLSKASVSSLFKSQIEPHLPERPSLRRPCGSGQTPSQPLSHTPVCLVFFICFMVFSLCARLSPAIPLHTHARTGRQLCAGWTLVRPPLCPQYLNRAVHGAATSSHWISGKAVGGWEGVAPALGAGSAHPQQRLLWTQSVRCAASAAQPTARCLWNCLLSLSFSSENNMAAVSQCRYTEKKDRRTSHSSTLEI